MAENVLDNINRIQTVDFKDQTTDNIGENLVLVLDTKEADNAPDFIKDQLTGDVLADLKATKSALVYGGKAKRTFVQLIDTEKLNKTADGLTKVAEGVYSALEGKKIVETGLWISTTLNGVRRNTFLNQLIIASHKFCMKTKTGATPSEEPEYVRVNKVTVLDSELATDATHKADFDFSVVKAHAYGYTNNIGKTRGSVATPEFMEEQARYIAERFSTITVESIVGEDLKNMGAGLITAVGQAATSAPRIVTLSYKGNPESNEWIGLVGKGITYDTGGLNLKPGMSMNGMYFDKMGATNVLGIFKGLGESNLKINVAGSLALAENAIDAASYKPEDILNSLKGFTVEVGNTDAEGRLALADTMTNLQRTVKPSTLIDMATLTGAMVVALGTQTCGVFFNDDELATDLVAAGNEALEKAWKMPIMDNHREDVKGKEGDLRNLGKDSWGGACTAASFLENFVEKDTKWAHVDIAGPAAMGGRPGFGAQLILNFLRNKSA